MEQCPTELGIDTWTFYCQLDVVFSVYVGQKKKKTKRQGWVTILFLFHLVRLVGPS